MSARHTTPVEATSQGESTLLNMKRRRHAGRRSSGHAPPLGVILPSGSSLQGGTLSANLGIAGPVDKLVITGPIRLAHTKLAGFNLASKMSDISAVCCGLAENDTSIRNLSNE